MKYKVNQKGIEALNATSGALKQGVEQLAEISAKLLDSIGGNEEGGGPHFEEITELSNAISEAAKDLDEPVEDICESLDDLAESYQDIIDKKLNDGSKGSSGDNDGFSGYLAGVLGTMYGDNYRGIRQAGEEKNGESFGHYEGNTFIPDDDAVPALANDEGKTFGEIKEDLKDRYGIEFTGVPYNNTEADFSGIAIAQVDLFDIESRMATDRGKDPMDPIMNPGDYNDAYADRNANFDRACDIAAEKGLPIPGLPAGYSGKDLRDWMKENKFTWDESVTNGYILVPSAIHNNIPHTGLVGKMTHIDDVEKNITDRYRRIAEKEGKASYVYEKDAYTNINDFLRDHRKK